LPCGFNDGADTPTNFDTTGGHRLASVDTLYLFVEFKSNVVRCRTVI